mgnify:CR=1 FL=1
MCIRDGDYANRIGEIVIGAVHQIQRDGIFINIEQAELRMPKSEQINSERYRRGESIRAVIKSVEVTAKGPDIIVSRSDNHFLYKLFELEVPEIEDGIIEITAIARHPGERAKIIVKSNDRRIDPVGACVGMRGSRIQAIVRELNNEKIDIVNHSEQAEILLSRALSPAKPVQLYIDDDKKYCVALFEDESLDAAIGRNGMNINLASKITDYKIDGYGVNQYERIQLDQKTPLKDIDSVNKTIAELLSSSGIEMVSDLLDADMDDLLSIEGVDEISLDEAYEGVQLFIEREIESEDEEEILDLQTENISTINDIQEEDQILEIDPELDLNINQKVRAVNIPESIKKKSTHDKIETKVNPMDLAKESLKLGMKALSGEDGPMADCIIYGASLILNHVTSSGIKSSSNEIKKVLKSGSALTRFKQI